MTTVERQVQICQQYPHIFGERGIYFECEEGWFGLIAQLCECMQRYYDDNTRNSDDLTQPRIVALKEKYGRLSIFLEGGDELVEGMVWFAEHLSGSICERTGHPGKLRKKGGWYKTLCDEEAVRLGFEDP